MFHDTPTKPGALVAPLNLAAICTARDAALARVEEGAAALRAAYDLTQDAAQTAKGAHGGWHSPRTDRGEESALNRLVPGRFDPADSSEAFRRDLDAAIWTRLLEETGLRKIMDAKERDDLDRAMQGDVPPARVGWAFLYILEAVATVRLTRSGAVWRATRTGSC